MGKKSRKFNFSRKRTQKRHSHIIYFYTLGNYLQLCKKNGPLICCLSSSPSTWSWVVRQKIFEISKFSIFFVVLLTKTTCFCVFTCPMLYYNEYMTIKIELYLPEWLFTLHYRHSGMSLCISNNCIDTCRVNIATPGPVCMGVFAKGRYTLPLEAEKGKKLCTYTGGER